MINKLTTLKLAATLLLFSSQMSFADVLVSPGTCDVSSATLTTVKVSDFDIEAGTGGATGDELLKHGPYTATSCIGLYPGNDDQAENPTLNIGQYGDGLLNGGNIKGDNLTGLEFIDPTDLQDVDGVNGANDPGWIHLANFQAGESSSIKYSEVGPWNGITLELSDVLQLSFSCTDAGEQNFKNCSSLDWTLSTDKDIVDTVQNVIGESTFDHLAFSVKSGAGKKKRGGWAVYDFDFKEIFGEEFSNGNKAFDFTTAYVLGGTIDLGFDFLNKKGKARGLSHLNVWARDPADTATVPEPSSIAVLGLSLLLLAGNRKFFKK
jgi:hypothetical protein